jgi:hypothetical protein
MIMNKKDKNPFGYGKITLEVSRIDLKSTK